jgi:hypothetical protein
MSPDIPTTQWLSKASREIALFWKSRSLAMRW